VKVTTERLPKSVVALDIELEPQQVQKGLEKAARKLSQQFRIPGFRPGKAPRQIVENYFGRERLLEEATDDLIQKSFPEALKQENIEPVGRPTLESVGQEPFRYRVTVPVEPEVALADYASYRLPFEPEAVSDETVEKLLDAQREQHVVLKELEEPRPAQPGDMVTVVVESDEDEDDDEETTTVELDDDEVIEADQDEDDEDEDDGDEDDEDDEVAELDLLDADDDDDEEDDEDDEDEDEGQEQQIALVEGRVRPEIYEALIGAQPGDTRTVTITYGDDEDESLRGQSVTYTMTVKNVQERLLPDWEELPTLTEFEGDIDALRANSRERLERAAEDKARRELIEQFLNQLSDETPFEIPQAMIEDRATELFHQQVGEFQRYGISEDQYLTMRNQTHEEAVAEYAEQAEKDVRRSLVVRELIRREGITIDDADLQTENERFLEEFDAERRDEVQKMLAQPNMRQMIASAALDRKLRDRLVALATGQATAQRGEEGQMTDAANERTQPTVQSDISTGGLENSVFEDVGADPTSATGTSSVEQATTADYGQKRTSEEGVDDETATARSNEA
jgi:trigger factor